MNQPRQIEDMTADPIESHEIMERPATPVAVANRYMTASTLELSGDEKKILNRPVSPQTECEIRPDGLVFMSQVHYRRRLNEAFGQGQWCLMPTGPWIKENNQLYREYALFVRGCFVAESVGEAEYQPDNANMTWATATEAVKSDALKRCCKDLGIGSECWDRRFTDEFQRTYCVRVYRAKQKDPKRMWAWRRKDAEPFWDEGKAPEPIQQPERKSNGNGNANGNSSGNSAPAQEKTAQDSGPGVPDWSLPGWRKTLITQISTKKGQSGRGEYTNYRAELGHKLWAGTFSKTVGEMLIEAHQSQRVVYVRTEDDGKFTNIAEVWFEDKLTEGQMPS